MSLIDVFRFLDAGRLIDGELELIEPSASHIDDVLAACTHPLTIRHAPNDAKTTREDLVNFLKAAPRGRFPGDPEQQRVPSYTFWMRLRDQPRRPAPICIAGGCTLRVGSNDGIELYYGNIGYHVYPPARGRHYAERACRLLIPFFRRHGQRTLWITCGPENHASRRTCERLGMEFLGIVPVPMGDPLFERGEREKCRYRMSL